MDHLYMGNIWSLMNNSIAIYFIYTIQYFSVFFFPPKDSCARSLAPN